MTGLVNPGGARAPVAKASADHLELLKDTVRSTLSLSDDTAVLIQQLACSEQGCPPVETVVAVLGTPRRTWKFADPAAHIAAARVHTALVTYPEGHDHDHHDR